ncbi:hypothetical protein FQN60_017925 [Etheostoma spectabile]|uniref:C-C motif chemokine n=1 Tax=Etheostoma spectabile TaxID=54343 RepID=A0A5J5DGX3_9PERO|nr:hypothetical protein FQN60_007059 [Etheostoma spectabile]KAA8592470.1 hypothetical protein FQN60_017925 [Etheostoma spectabile]
MTPERSDRVARGGGGGGGVGKMKKQAQPISLQRDEETSPQAQQPDMAPWGDAKFFFCILFITCCTVTLAQIPMDCCLSVSHKTIDKSRVADYRRQISGRGCSIDAMIFVTRRGMKLCVSADKPWIQEVVKHGKRCLGVKHE